MYEAQVSPIKLQLVSDFAKQCCHLEGVAFEICIPLETATGEQVGGTTQLRVFLMQARAQYNQSKEFFVKCRARDK